MLTGEEFERSRHLVYRHGDLLTRKRFAHHFEGGSRGAVVDALASDQNEDGGCGHGLELDLQCPDSSGIALEAALGILLESGVATGSLIDRAEEWIHANRMGRSRPEVPARFAAGFETTGRFVRHAGDVEAGRPPSVTRGVRAART